MNLSWRSITLLGHIFIFLYAFFILLIFQELNLPEAVVNRLQTVGLRFCGAADQALPRLRGALPTGIAVFIYCLVLQFIRVLRFFCHDLIVDKATRKALDELSDVCSYLRVWRIERRVYIDPLMPPTESYHRELFFQVFRVVSLFGHLYSSEGKKKKKN